MGPRRTSKPSATLAARIAEGRRSSGMSQAALAAAASLDRTAISKIESTRRAVRSDELARIAHALAKPIDWFLSKPAVAEDAMRTIRRKRAAILRIARKHGARSVRVFGSTARGEARPDSDVDLLVEMDAARGLLDQAALMLELRDVIGRDVDVVTPQGLRDRIRERVLREAVPL